MTVEKSPPAVRPKSIIRSTAWDDRAEVLAAVTQYSHAMRSAAMRSAFLAAFPQVSASECERWHTVGIGGAENGRF